jgi:hypothetical protein
VKGTESLLQKPIIPRIIRNPEIQTVDRMQEFSQIASGVYSGYCTLKDYYNVYAIFNTALLNPERPSVGHQCNTGVGFRFVSKRGHA